MLHDFLLFFLIPLKQLLFPQARVDLVSLIFTSVLTLLDLSVLAPLAGDDRQIIAGLEFLARRSEAAWKREALCLFHITEPVWVSSAGAAAKRKPVENVTTLLLFLKPFYLPSRSAVSASISVLPLYFCPIKQTQNRTTAIMRHSGRRWTHISPRKSANGSIFLPICGNVVVI